MQDSSEASSPTPETKGVSLDAIGSKTLAHIKDCVDFEGALRNSVVGEARRNLSRAAVILVEAKSRSVYLNVLRTFHMQIILTPCAGTGLEWITSFAAFCTSTRGRE